VESSQNTYKISNVPVIACVQRHHSVHTTFQQRLIIVHDASTACKKLLQRVHGALVARTQRAYSVFTATIAFKICFTYIFEQPYFANKVITFDFSKQFAIVFNNY